MRNRLNEAATEVHNRLGSGWSESVYHSAYERELSERGIPFHSEGSIPVMYKGAPVGRRRPDMFVVTEYGLIVVELKAGSTSGEEQLQQYIGMTTDLDDLGEIVGGILIQFNNELSFEYRVVGPE